MAASVARAAGTDRSCRVAIVGAGPAGIASCRFLREAGHQPVVFEGGSEVGGIWAPQPTNPVVYPNLVTNIPTMCMQSFDLDFPEGLPSYVRTADLGKYMAMYADHFDIRRLVRFGTHVTSVRPLCSEEAEARGESAWRVSWTPQQEDGDPADPQAQGPEGSGSDTFDAVVVASGHYDTPYVPEIPGQAEWLQANASDREVSHSVTYRGPEPYRDRTVLVVGGRSSAVDIARELRATAHWVYVLEKSCGPRPQAVGRCTHLPIGARLRPDGRLALGDGEESVEGPPVQSLVLATGYGYRFPFLDADELGLDFGPAKRYVAPLYMHVLHARRPTLCFVGVPLAVPVPMPLFEAQARMLAAHLRRSSFDVTHFQAWCERRRAEVGERSQDMHFLSTQAWEYQKELIQLSGMAGPDLESYCRRLDVVQSIYADRVRRKPAYPWDDDDYRLCEYDVDWDAGTWSVRTPAAGE